MTKERYTIGRLPDNDIRVDNAAVSGHHSLIINILNDSFLEDLNSTNGTYVNGKLIKKHALQHGDVITAGHHQLRYVDDQLGEVDSDPDDEFQKTMVIEPNQDMEEQIAKVAEAAEAAAAQATPEISAVPAAMAAGAGSALIDETSAATDEAEKSGSYAPTSTQTVNESEAPAALPRAKLQVLSGTFAGRELELTKTLTTLGRPGAQVAAVSRRAEGFFIVHVESGKLDDYPLVNGQPIGPKARQLEDNDVIQLAGVKMGFFVS
jgi:pSer/pThr/pTyr-binding forkhead associated (FHA) protein